MKILAISGGRAGGNNEMLLRAALQAAGEVCGAEIEVIRIHDLYVKSCIGCESCMRGLTTGGDGKCVLKDDDLWWLTEQVGGADGLIITAPIYDLIPSGKMINLLNRALGLGNAFQKECRADPKVGAYLSLGGSDWVNFSEPIMDLMVHNLSKGSVVVDRLIVGHNPAPSMVVLDDTVMERARRLGRNVGQALLKREKGEPFGFMGEKGVCPACGCNLLEMRGGDQVACPYCNARGTLTVEKEQVKLVWDMESVEKSRFTLYGEIEHRNDIARGHKLAAEHRETIRRRMEDLEDFGGRFIRPR